MLDIGDLYSSGGTLEQDGPRVPGERYGADEDHDGYKHARCRVCVEAPLESRLPYHHSSDDDADVVDGVSDDVDQNTEHAEITTGRLKLGHVMTVLRMSSNGLQPRLA